MAKVKQTALIGGRFKIGKRGGRKPTDFMGLVSTAQEAIEQSEIRLPDTTTPMGGTYETVYRIDKFTLALNLRELNKRNLANALYASINEVPSDTVTGESVIVGVGQTTALEKMPLEIILVTDKATGLVEFEEDLDWRITGAGIEVLEGSDLADAITGAAAGSVTSTAGGSNTGNGTLGAASVTENATSGAYTVTFTSATAYSVAGPGGALGVGGVGSAFSAGGVGFTIVAGSTAFVSGDTFAVAVVAAGEYQVEVDYLTATFDEVEVLTNSGEEFYILFEGTNAVGEKGKFNAHYWNVKFSPTESRDVIGVEDFMGLQLTCEVQREESRATGDAKSAYAKLQIQRAVA